MINLIWKCLWNLTLSHKSIFKITNNFHLDGYVIFRNFNKDVMKDQFNIAAKHFTLVGFSFPTYCDGKKAYWQPALSKKAFKITVKTKKLLWRHVVWGFGVGGWIRRDYKAYISESHSPRRGPLDEKGNGDRGVAIISEVRGTDCSAERRFFRWFDQGIVQGIFTNIWTKQVLVYLIIFSR